MKSTGVPVTDMDTDNALNAIAVVGMAGRFPGADNIDEFWSNIRDGVESITFFSDEELLEAGIDPELLKKPNYVKAKSPLSDVDLFDARFFGISPREAAAMDPQHRFFLECAWEALENAGYDADRYPGRIGVFAGVGANHYLYNNLLRSENPGSISDILQMSIGNDKDFVPTRVSYYLNLTGPSINVNTACSSALVAVSLAVHSLLSYQSDMAMAGGVAIHLPSKSGYLHQAGMILSPDGHCRAFDARAQGTVEGDGVGIVVLKRLADALAEGDTIHAVIRGCAINNDGANKVGYTAPGVEGQAAAIAEALAMADVSPATISYIEAHGTGTALGDPIEIAALTEVFRTATTANQYCAVGSVKSNLGHTDAAAGVAGLIKTVEALKHRQIPPSLHFSEPNPDIPFATSPFYINTRLQDWPGDTTPRRAGVNSFGIGGTNAHVVVEEAPPPAVSAASRTSQLLPLSAKTPSALARIAANLADRLQRFPEANLADVAFTLTQRHPMPYRHTVVAKDVAQAVTQLAALGKSPVKAQEEARVGFLFSGQGTQYVDMARDLYDAEPLFRATVDRCAVLLQPHLGIDLREVLYPTGDRSAAERNLLETAMAQPALFTIEYALASLWMAWGVRPVALIGHSVGEYVAACLAGVFSLEDGLALIAARGRLMQGLPPGAMLAVPLKPEAVSPYLNPELAIAAINENDRCVIAGTCAAIDALHAELTRKGLTCRPLHVSHAFHSPMMDPILSGFESRVSRIPLQPPATPYVSNLSGTWITAEEATSPAYWARHLRETVRFADGLTSFSAAVDVLLEVGPGHTLATFARRGRRDPQVPIFTSLRAVQEDVSDLGQLQSALGYLWRHGAKIDWNAYYANESRRRVPLPVYPFERQRCWIEPSAAAPLTSPTLRRLPVADWFYAPSWKLAPLPRRALTETEVWLLFLDQAGLGERLASALRHTGQTVITVQAGPAFAELSGSAFAIRPGVASDYSALLQALPNMPRKVVHLWSVSGDEEASPDQAETNSFYSLLYFTQALGQQRVVTPLEVFVVANQLHDVTGADPVTPVKATLVGPVRVLPQEYPNVACCAIDVPWLATEADARQTVEQLTNEFADISDEPLIAYRGRRRWLATAEPIRLSESRGSIREGGVYLITGGMGGIGLAVAEALLPYRPKLALLGRSPLPEQGEWDAWLAEHSADDATSRKIRAVQELKAGGAELLVLTADVSDAAEMRAATSEITNRFGSVHGVIHAAGIGGANIISQTTDEAVASVLSPKMRGTLVLDEVLRDVTLDFFVLCSSLSSFLGGVGQVAYTAANAFQDAFAASRAASYPVLSLNWDAWREVGMAAYQFVDGHRAPPADYGLSRAEGQKLFLQALGSGLTQLLISTLEFGQVVRLNRKPDSPTPGAVIPKQSRPDLGVPYVAPGTPVERWLTGIWQESLAIEQIGVNDDYFLHLGQDSLNAMGLVNQIQEKLGAILHLKAIFDAPTIARMAAYMEQNYPDALQSVLGLAVVTRRDDPNHEIGPALLSGIRAEVAANLPRFRVPATKNPRAVFLLSPPRAGSTLLRVMLSGHHQLFAPPELGLLGLEDVADMLTDSSADYLRHGSVRALMQIRGCDAEQAEREFAGYAAQGLSTQEFYAIMQAEIGDRLLVDKTPFYAFHTRILQRAEELFQDALYIHLLRHPYGMIRSFEEVRLDLNNALPAAHLSRRELAEATWALCNENILEFLESVPSARKHQIRYEDLVTQPEAVMRDMCRFLGIDFDPSLLQPYQDSGQRMTDGVHQGARMIGDPKFHRHKAISPDAATQWARTYTEDFLSESTGSLANRLGYVERVQSSLISLQAGDERPPVFCVPGITGNVLSLSQVARQLEAGQPFYGLQPVGVDGKAAPLPTMEAVAAQYIADIRRRYPRGPYYLAGHSFGGRVAFEMARQLIGQGHEVPRLFIFDTYWDVEGLQSGSRPAAGTLSEVDWLTSLAQAMGLGTERQLRDVRESLIAVPEGDRLNRLLTILKSANLTPAHTDAEQLLALDLLYRANYGMVRYPESPVPVSVTLFQAEERTPERDAVARRDPSAGWKALVTGDVEIVPVPGDHFTMLANPFASELARRLTACLESLIDRPCQTTG